MNFIKYKNALLLVVGLRDLIFTFLYPKKDVPYSVNFKNKKEALEKFVPEFKEEKIAKKRWNKRVCFVADFYTAYFNKLMERVLAGDVYKGMNFEIKVVNKKHKEEVLKVVAYKAYIKEQRKLKDYSPKVYYRQKELKSKSFYKLKLREVFAQEKEVKITLGDFRWGIRKKIPSVITEALTVTKKDKGARWKPHQQTQEILFPSKQS